MIYLGSSDAEKDRLIREFCNDNQIKKVFVLAPQKHFFDCSFENCEFVEYKDIIRYVYFYRLLQEIDTDTLVVVNECLQTKNRNDLTYNCIRNFLNQTDKQIVFNYLPIIESQDDFFTLFDFDTRSKWKRETDSKLLHNSDIEIKHADIIFSKTDVFTDRKTKNQYAKKKKDLISNIGLKDPHIIPRNLLLLAGKSKLSSIDEYGYYVGRNNRFKLDNLIAYRESEYPAEYKVFEFCHNFIDFANFVTLSRQTHIDALVSDMMVDAWYFERYCNWAEEIQRAYAEIRQE